MGYALGPKSLAELEGVDPRLVAVVKRAIQITVELGVDTIGTEFNGRPERAEESERAFFRSMEELLPIIEKEGINVFIDPHPDDFVENGLAAWRVIRGINSKNFGMAYVASHTFHMGN